MCVFAARGFLEVYLRAMMRALITMIVRRQRCSSRVERGATEYRSDRPFPASIARMIRSRVPERASRYYWASACGASGQSREVVRGFQGPGHQRVRACLPSASSGPPGVGPPEVEPAAAGHAESMAEDRSYTTAAPASLAEARARPDAKKHCSCTASPSLLGAPLVLNTFFTRRGGPTPHGRLGSREVPPCGEQAGTPPGRGTATASATTPRTASTSTA